MKRISQTNKFVDVLQRQIDHACVHCIIRLQLFLYAQQNNYVWIACFTKKNQMSLSLKFKISALKQHNYRENPGETPCFWWKRPKVAKCRPSSGSSSLPLPSPSMIRGVQHRNDTWTFQTLKSTLVGAFRNKVVMMMCVN